MGKTQLATSLGPVLALLLLLGRPHPAAAQEKKSDARVLIVMQESVEGRRSGSKGAEPELAKRFLAEGFQVVERFESDGVASRLPLERILNDEVRGNEISAINADVLVVGRVDMSKEDLPYGLKGKAFEASMEIRVLLTDSGRVIYSKSGTITRPGSSAKVSAELAGQLATELVSKVQEALSSRAVIEVRISGLKAAKHADKVAQALAKHAGVSSAKVRYVSADVTIIDLKAKGLAASALESTMAAAGLVVSQRSANVISASYDALKASQRSIIVASFENRTQNSAHDWIQSVGPEIFETEIDNSRYLSAKILSTRSGASKAQALKAARAGKADLVVMAFFQPVGPKLRLSAQIVRSSDGKVIAKAQVIGDDAEAVEVVTKLVWKLDQLLYKKLNPKGSLDGYETKVRKYAPAGSVPTASGGLAMGGEPAAVAVAQVVISDSTIQPIFPAQLAHYANRPFGEVVLSNAGKSDAIAVRLGIKVEGLIDGEHLLQVDDIPAGAQVRVPLTAVFDRSKLIETTQRRPVRVDLRVQYLSSGKVASDTITSSTVLHDRNAMNWQEGRAISAFVTYRDPFVEEFTRNALSAIGNTKVKLPVALINAVTLWNAIPESGMKYRRDPVAAFGEQAVDAVYFPRDTLLRSVGDCDDLAVLYSALIAASGGNARIVYTPGHVFVAVDTELDQSRADLLGGAARTLTIDGRAWLPIEITKLEGGFLAAWEQGIAEIGRYGDQQDKISYVDFRSDWLSYPPFPLQQAKTEPRAPGKGLAALVEKDMQALAAKRYGAAKITLPPVHNSQAEDVADALQESPWRLLRNGTESARQGDYSEAVSYFSAATKVPETLAAANNNLGNTYSLLERYDDAIGYYTKALSSKRLRGLVGTNLGFAQYQSGQGKQAARTLRKANTKEAKRLLVQLGLAKPSRGTKPASKPKDGEAASGQLQSDALYGMRAGHLEPSSVLIWIEQSR